ncbi:MAG: HNH endonuclease [Trebonia sp.]
MNALIADKPVWNIDRIPCASDDPLVMPVEHLEARICELAGHITAATCRYLLLVADFDEREGWASWEMPSCAAWLAWKCQVAPGTAREHVRVARAIKDLPFIRREFAAARLSYAKVRALTRIATPDSEQVLAEMALPMTAGQLDRFVRAHRQVAHGEQDGRPACREPKVNLRTDESGVRIGMRLPPAEGALVLQALRAWLNDVDHPHDGQDDGPAKTRGQRMAARDAAAGVNWDAPGKPWQREKTFAADMAEALVQICGEYLSGRAATAANPDNYQVIIHAGTGALTGAPDPGALAPDAPAGPPDTSPGTPGAPAGAPPRRPAPSQQAMDFLKETVPLLTFPETSPAWPWRSHVEDGGPVDPATLQMIACNATISTMLHDQHGTVMNAGRRTRKPSAALRRAVRERDRYRCRFPGCESRRVDLHHIQFWANGGETKFENLICLCKRHHLIVHDKGIIIARTGDGFTFYLPDGALISNSPPLPDSSADAITRSHDADISYPTIVPPGSGERLNLHEAIWVCLNNIEARSQAPARTKTGNFSADE